MARDLVLKTGDILNAAKQLRLLKQATDTPTPGMPTPPFGALLRVGAALRALLPFAQAFDQQQVRLQAEFAMKNEDGEGYRIAKDANGNIINGGFYIANQPEFNQRLVALQNEEQHVTLGALSMDDVLDVGQTRLGVDAIAELLPILDSEEPSADALARFARAEAVIAARPTTAVPQTDANA